MATKQTKKQQPAKDSAKVTVTNGSATATVGKSELDRWLTLNPGWKAISKETSK
jgi:hypothetical protein